VLARAERLQRRRDFAAVYARKKSWASPLLVLYVRRHSPESEWGETRRFGFSVSKKVSKGAVVRNRVKRRLRAICRARGPHWRKGFDAVFVARSACARASYADLETAVCALVGRAGLAAAATAPDVRET
jgi:ribonuclease P protein component